MNNNLLKRIITNPKIMLGKPTIRGTRLTVEIILEKLAAGVTEEDIFKKLSYIRKGRYTSMSAIYGKISFLI